MDTNSRLAEMLDQEEAYETKKHCCLRPIIEYFGISVAFCYYSLLGRVIDFPSRVRVVKKIPSTGRVASTRHSLLIRVTLDGIRNSCDVLLMASLTRADLSYVSKSFPWTGLKKKEKNRCALLGQAKARLPLKCTSPPTQPPPSSNIHSLLLQYLPFPT